MLKKPIACTLALSICSSYSLVAQDAPASVTAQSPETTATSTGTQASPSPSPTSTAQQAPNPQSQEAAPAGFVLLDGTPVKLRLSRNLSSGTDRKGDTVDFEVLEDVMVDHVVVIPKGGTALATITEAEPKKHMGRGGKLDVNIDSVRLKDNEKIALRAI